MTIEEKKEKFEEIAKRNIKNREISIILGISFSTVCLWKRQLRDKGVEINTKAGRPKKNG